MQDAFQSVEQAYRIYVQKMLEQPPIMSIDIPEHYGELDIKFCYSKVDETISIKSASGYWNNSKQYKLPNLIASIILLVGWDESTEVVVIGSGFAGLAAAIEACDSGASVIIIEKIKAAGGNSMISDGGIATPRTALLEKWGIEDSIELMVEDMLKAGLRMNDLALVKTVGANANDVLEWTKAH